MSVVCATDLILNLKPKSKMNSPDSILPEKGLITTFTAMKMSQRWLLWKLEQRLKNGQPELDKNENPKFSKVPYYITGSKRFGKLDTEPDWAKLANYDEAVLALEQSRGLYTGLGFALGADADSTGRYWQGVDLDDVIACGNESIANEIKGYVETSPSGDGCHAIGCGEWFPSLGSNGSGLEAYAGGRYFTVTENVIRDGSMICLASYVNEVLNPRHKRDKASSPRDSIVPNSDNKPQPIGELSFVNVAPSVVTELRSALASMRSDDRDLWVRVGMALFCLGGTGRGLWLDWSASSEKHKSLEDARTWDSFKVTKISYETVFHLAQEHGWVNPLSNEANNKMEKQFKPLSVDVSEPAIEVIKYLDDPYIPRGFAIGVFGRGESSKSTFISTLVAKNSDQYGTLWITSEESHGHIKIRHRESGGQARSLAVFGGEFDIYEHLEAAIVDAKDKLGAPLGFVVLDAIVALVSWGKGESPNDDSSVKRLLRYVNSLARTHNISIIFIGHTNKGKDHVNIADSINGSTAWTNSVRLAYMLQPLPDVDFTGMIQVVKTNLIQKFCQFYKTTPVYRMQPNIDGVEAVLCKVELISERKYGMKAMELEMDSEDGELTKRELARKLKISDIVERIKHTLSAGVLMYRAEIEAAIAPTQIIPRVWLSVDQLLIEHGVTVTKGLHNKNQYQITSEPHDV